MQDQLTGLADTVRRNCHISDARHARDYSLCIYLLKMREYYRWEKGYGYTDRLPEEELGNWLVEREALWHDVEQEDFADLPIDGRHYHPFESTEVNDRLLPAGLVYSGGVGGGGRPHFFLAELEQQRDLNGRTALVTGAELARDITAPPAMTQNETIYVRKESLRRMLWERLEEWQWRKRENAMARAARHYDFDRDFDTALNHMTDAETEVLIQHELGELAAGARVGSRWEEMLSRVSRRDEFFARAVRDHSADCSCTLPHLLEHNAEASIHVYMANLSGIRKAIFPELLAAYEAWLESGRPAALEKAVRAGEERWRAVMDEMMAIWERDESAEAPFPEVINRFSF